MPVKNPTREMKRRWNYSSRYGLTPEQVLQKITDQGGVCAICKKEMKRPCVDHCHKTKRVRGVLCHKCNIYLHAIERVGYVTAAFEYLAEHGAVGGAGE